MKQGLTRRHLLAGAGATFGAAAALGTAGRKALAQAAGVAPRWGIAVDVGRCAARAGCRACIDACHLAHRVPASADAKHEIKWLWKEPFARVFSEQLHPYEPEQRLQTPVLVACNHCKEAPCVKVCPTAATWRRSDGVVAMDQHRCIGCRYCMTACPYGARSFNWVVPQSAPSPAGYPARTKGVVEKCTLCVERIDRGETPLCVDTCKGAGAGALTFGNLDDSQSPLRQLLATRQVLRRKPSLGTEPSIFYLV